MISHNICSPDWADATKQFFSHVATNFRDEKSSG